MKSKSIFIQEFIPGMLNKNPTRDLKISIKTMERKIMAKMSLFSFLQE